MGLAELVKGQEELECNCVAALHNIAVGLAELVQVQEELACELVLDDIAASS